MINHARHARTFEGRIAASPSLRSKIGSGIVASCLAASMLPALAFAAPASMPTMDQVGSAPTASQQEIPDGQAPDFAAMAPGFDGQAPSFGNAMPEFAGQMPSFGEQMPAFGEQAPSFDGQMPEFDGQMPAFDGQESSAPADFAGQLPQNAPEAPGENPPAAPSPANGMSDDNSQAPGAFEGVDGENGQAAPQPPAQGAPASFNGPSGGDDTFQFISDIPDDDIRARALAGNQDVDNVQPAIPEGELNVAQLLDQIRSMANEAPAQNAPDADASMPEAPDGMQAPDGTQPPAQPDGMQAPDGTQPPAQPDGNASSQAPEGPAPTGDDTSSLPLFQQIIEFFKNLFAAA